MLPMNKTGFIRPQKATSKEPAPIENWQRFRFEKMQGVPAIMITIYIRATIAAVQPV
jgi:hypothetical protein